jgi:predicted PurR-regulated permease PerM
VSCRIVRIFGEGSAHAESPSGTTRGVVHGILGTALIQGILAAIGFLVAGVPAAPLLGLATFFLSPVPVGPPLVWLPAAFWLFNHGQTGWAIFMLIWGTAVVSSVDNVIKPLIISRGSNMPFILKVLAAYLAASSRSGSSACFWTDVARHRLYVVERLEQGARRTDRVSGQK